MYGAQLIRALRRRLQSCRSSSETPVAPSTNVAGTAVNPWVPLSTEAGPHPDTGELAFFGVGGEKMRAAGCDLVVHAKELSVVGITEILAHLPKIWRLFHQLIREADRRRADLAIVIDSPAFNWRVARHMKKRGIPVVYYVCPQFWAWRQGRVRLLRRYVDKALVIFPFEEKFYRDRGVQAEFVGHPLAELPRPAISREQYAREHGLAIARRWITLMPGSRKKEIRMNLPEMLRATSLLGSDYEFLLPVAPTLDRKFVEDLIGAQSATSSEARSGAGGESAPAEAPKTGAATVHLVPEAVSALAHSRVGIVASGTATVEAAMMETPFVMVYRVTPLTYWLGRWTVKVPHFSMVNLIAGEQVVPELVQRDFTAERVVSEVSEIIPDGARRRKMIEDLQKMRTLLSGRSGEGQAADRAAEAITGLLRAQVPSPSDVMLS
jgi:lipid-A-disaccharide synthase